MSKLAVRPTASESPMYVTMRIDGQLFGINVNYVRDVVHQQHVTPIPLAPKEVLGSFNLRGRIVTVIDVRRRLSLAVRQDEGKGMFVVIDVKGELYSLKVDSVGEVLDVPAATIEPPPSHIGSWKEISSGIHKLEDELLVIVNIQTILNL